MFRGCVCFRQSYGGHSERETPGPIPNPEVKPFSADGTATERLWESRTPPDIHSVVEATVRWPLLISAPFAVPTSGATVVAEQRRSQRPSGDGARRGTGRPTGGKPQSGGKPASGGKPSGSGRPSSGKPAAGGNREKSAKSSERSTRWTPDEGRAAARGRTAGAPSVPRLPAPGATRPNAPPTRRPTTAPTCRSRSVAPSWT